MAKKLEPRTHGDRRPVDVADLLDWVYRDQKAHIVDDWGRGLHDLVKEAARIVVQRCAAVRASPTCRSLASGSTQAGRAGELVRPIVMQAEGEGLDPAAGITQLIFGSAS